MSGFRQPELPRKQMHLWGQRLEDALPEDHPVRLLDELLRSPAFAAPFAAWEQDYDRLTGQPPYHPRDLAGLYLYGLLSRLRSSRQLEMACHNRIAVLWLLSGQTPDHATIAAFVTEHAGRLKALKKAVLEVGIRARLVRLDHTAVDGTKIEADAGRGAVWSEAKIRAELAKLDGQLAAWEAEWQANEQRETALFGDQTPWIPPAGAKSVPQRLARAQRAQQRLNQALAELQRRQAEAAAVASKPPKAIAVVTDPDSRVLKDKEGRRKANYNAQVAVDTAAGMIVADAVNDRAEDSGQLTPVLEQVGENCGRLPAEASADSQYNTGPELAKLEELEVTGYVAAVHQRSDGAAPVGERAAALAAVRAGQELTDPQWAALPRNEHGYLDKAAFGYDAARDEYRCPAGQRLTFLRTSQDRQRGGVTVRRQYRAATCAGCSHAARCGRDPAQGRRVNRDQYEEVRERMRVRLATPAGRQRYALRKQTVEPRIGYLKHGLGLRRFLRRGLPKVGLEFTWFCLAVNVGILLRHWEEVRGVL
jgi:transposase